jgi:hypothetical protein
MGRVYEQSKVTLAWLGEASENSDSAMDFLDELEKLPTLSEKGVFLIRQIMLEPCTETGYDALFKLFCRPWWTRMWIVQELLLSKTVVLWCGDQWEYWGKLAQFHDLLTMAQHAFVPEISWPDKEQKHITLMSCSLITSAVVISKNLASIFEMPYC